MLKDQNLVVQVTAAKLFDESSKFKAQYTISDGVVSMTAIILQSTYEKLVSTVCVS